MINWQVFYDLLDMIAGDGFMTGYRFQSKWQQKSFPPKCGK